MNTHRMPSWMFVASSPDDANHAGCGMMLFPALSLPRSPCVSGLPSSEEPIVSYSVHRQDQHGDSYIGATGRLRDMPSGVKKRYRDGRPLFWTVDRDGKEVEGCKR